MIAFSAGQIAVLVQLAATAAVAAGFQRLTRGGVKGWTAAAMGAACAALALAGLLISDPPHAFQDFRDAYYPAGRAVLHSSAELQAVSARGVSGFVNLPVVAYAFAPLALLPLPVAIALFSLLGLAATGLAWRLLADHARLDPRDRWLLALLFCANGPLLYSLKEGNTSHFVLLALVGGLVLLRSDRSGLAGLVLGLATVIKPPLLLFGPFFLLRRDWRASFAYSALLGLICLLSLICFGWRGNWSWFEDCILRFSHQWLAAFNVQSIPAALLRPTVRPAVLGTWAAFTPPPALAPVATIITAILFGTAILAALPRPGGEAAAADPRRDLQYLLVICLVLLGGPLSWSHYYCWLLVPAGLWLGSRHNGAMRGAEPALGWTAIALSTPLCRPFLFKTAWLEAAYKDVLVSHLLFAAVLWLALVAWRLSVCGGLLSTRRAARPGSRRAMLQGQPL